MPARDHTAPPVTASKATAVLTPSVSSTRDDNAPGLHTFATGEVVAERFRVVRFLGEGGMGQVFEAEDLSLGGRVALKVIHPRVAAVAGMADRFIAEIDSARRVTHGNVCRVFDLFRHQSLEAPAWGRSGGATLVISMELLEGQPLGAVTGTRTWTPAEALPLVVQMAAALDAAHANGVVHRDFKSDNIILVPNADGPHRVVVSDFGLAQVIDPDVVVAEPTGGTPAYQAPEVRAGAAGSAAADVYSWGVVVHEMLTGVRPREYRREYVVGLPRAWQQLLARCLATDPARRPRRAGDAVADLRRGGWLRRGRLSVLLLVSALVLAVVFLARDRDHPAQPLPIDNGAPTSELALEAYDQGMRHLAAGALADAVVELERAVASDPEAVLPRLALAEAWARQGRDRTALEAARHAFRDATDLPGAARLAVEGRFRELSGDLLRARELYAARYALAPDDVENGLRLVAVSTTMGDPDAALETVVALGRDQGPVGNDSRLDLAEATAARAGGYIERQRESAARAFEAAKAAGATALAAQARMLEAMALDDLGRRAEALEAAADVRPLYQEDQDPYGAALALLSAATAALAFEDALGLTVAQALAFARERGDRDAEAVALIVQARTRMDQASTTSDTASWLQQIETDLTRARSLARSLAQPRLITQALNTSAVLSWFKEDVQAAAEQFEEAIATARASGDRRLLAGTLMNAGNVHSFLLDHRTAHARRYEAVALFEAIGDRRDSAMALTNAANSASAAGEGEKAERAYQRARALGREIGDGRIEALALGGRATLAGKDGRFAEAIGDLEAALLIWQELESTPMADQVRVGLAHYLIRANRPDEALAPLRPLLERQDEDRYVVKMARLAQVRLLLGAGQLGAAERLRLAVASTVHPESEPDLALDVRFLKALLLAAAGDPQAGLAELEALLGDQAGKPTPPDISLTYGLEVGRLLLAVDEPTAATARLRVVAERASAHGLGAIAREARALVEGAVAEASLDNVETALRP